MEKIGWVSADDGILAYDANGDGEVDPLEEITFTQYLDGSQTDLEGWKFFDTNGDLIFNSDDAEFSSFGVWQDLNQNGVCDPGEFFTLDEMGILRINLDYEAAGTTNDGNTIHNTTSFTYTDLTGGLVGDVELGVEDTNLPQGIENAIDQIENMPFGDRPGLEQTLERLQARLERLEFRFGGQVGFSGFGKALSRIRNLRENLTLGQGLTDLTSDFSGIGSDLQNTLDQVNGFGFGTADVDARYQNLIQAMGAFGAGRGGSELDLQERINNHFDQGFNLTLPNG